MCEDKWLVQLNIAEICALHFPNSTEFSKTKISRRHAPHIESDDNFETDKCAVYL